MPPMLFATSSEPMSWHYEAIPGPEGTRFAEIRWFETVDSTNRYLVDEASRGAPEGLVAAAEHQSAGRGRLGRRWEAPAGTNLLASVLLRPYLDLHELHLLTVVVSLAAADACAELAGLDPQLKWPNDLLVGSRKLAGILAESVPGERIPLARGEAHERRGVVIGLGLNVLWPAPDNQAVPGFFEDAGAGDESSDVEHAATSLWRESALRGRAKRLMPRVVLHAVLKSIEGRLRDLAGTGGHERQMAEYRRRCATLGREVTVSVGEEIYAGTAVELSEEGHLVLRTPEGSRLVTAGDVVHLDQSFK